MVCLWRGNRWLLHNWILKFAYLSLGSYEITDYAPGNSIEKSISGLQGDRSESLKMQT
jgi:hypothetical protein